VLRLGDPARRLTAGFAAVCTLLVVLGGRLVQLQAFDGPRYAAAAQTPILGTTEIPAERGRIVDRDGRVLAYTVASRLVFADPKIVGSHASTAAAVLAPLLRQPAAKLEPLLRRPGRYVVLARDVTPTNAARILAQKIPGIGTQDTTQRLYPGDTAAGVLGFTGRDGQGQAGIELRYDKLLSGTPGEIVAEAGKDGQEIPSGQRKETPAIPGSTVRLTLSEDLQYTTQQALADAVRQSQALGGQAVVLDAHTGEVLAMASAAGYDPNRPATAARERQLGNPAVQAVFEPGSANKVVTFAGALDRGLIQPDTRLSVPGSLQVADRVIHDAWSHGLAKWTATGVLAKSSNVGTLMIAQRLGPAAFYDYLTRFGIGSRTGVQLPGESAGLLPTPDTWSGSTFGNLPIGQGVSMTALQLASMYQTVANDGVRVPPRIVAQVAGPTGQISTPAAAQQSRVVSQAAARTVRSMMEAVTQKGGTAPSAAIDGYQVSGKTGTGQKPNPACRCYSGGGYWATFAGMAPAQAPRFVIAIMIDNAKGGLHGGAVAAPLFHTIASYALTQEGVPPTGSGRSTFPLTWN
jgi:cell division protein FtsI (penicillin-binding protein 3)